MKKKSRYNSIKKNEILMNKFNEGSVKYTLKIAKHC